MFQKSLDKFSEVQYNISKHKILKKNWVYILDFIVIDLETTGLEPAEAEIIEIGAVKILDGQIAESFQTLVRPTRRLAPEISELTGITDAMLTDAPALEPALLALQDFAGDLSFWVAHNKDFESAFLRPHLERQPQWLDSIDIARIALPLERYFRLGHLIEVLQIEHDQLHRALADATATAKLLLILLRRLAEMPDSLWREWLLICGALSLPLAELMRGLYQNQNVFPEKFLPGSGDEKFAETPDNSKRPEPLDGYQLPAEQITKFFQTLPHNAANENDNFELRAEQVKMSELVTDAFNKKQVLLAEAGTGTGKSLAYLLPAALWAKGSKHQVIISTNTINLQEQLLNKDIPLLCAQLGAQNCAAPAEKPRAVVLKGRSNYICLRKWQALRTQADADTLALYLRLAHWLRLTKTGDFSELNLWGQELELMQELNAASETCLNFNCKMQRGGCFVSKVRRQAQQADLLILNHSLLVTASQLFGENGDGAGILPPARYLIVDEAHQLAAVAQRQFSQRFSSQQIRRSLHKHWQRLRPYELLRSLRKLSSAAQMTAKLEAVVQAYEKIVPAAAAFDTVSASLLPPQQFDRRHLRIDKQRYDLELWQPVENALGNLFFELKSFANTLSELLFAINDNDDPFFSMDAVAALQTMLASAHELLATAQIIIDGKNTQAEPGCENYVIWLEKANRGNGSSPAAGTEPPEWWIAPYDIRPLLNRCIYQDKEAIVFTSATMATAQDFSYFSNELGLELQELPIRSCLLPSPFDYQQNARLFLANDIADYTKNSEFAITQQLAEAIARLTKAANGRTLVLFTSYQQLNAVYALLRPLLQDTDIQLLAHGHSGGRNFILESMQKNPQTCVLGVSSFWEGVDIKGGNLSLLVIVRLPFAPPGTPTLEAKFEQIRQNGGNPFREYSLPQAVIRFKQGFGRLIRSKDDCGVCCVLDQRIWHKASYGKNFLRSLPEMPTKICSTSEMAEQIQAFLDK